VNMPPWFSPGSESDRDSIDPLAWMRNQLFDRRIVSLAGDLDDDEANRVGAALMTLDATGDEPVQLRIDCGDGTIGAALSVIDIIDLLGVPVRASCFGQGAGPVLGVLAVCDHRSLSPHARLRLVEPAVAVRGNARELQQAAANHQQLWTAFCARVSEVSRQSLDQVRADARSGRFFSAQEAVDYGLADEVAAPGARPFQLPGTSIGFGSRSRS
jgi:ATP-dependent Clp protease, protease subunit